MCESGLSSDHTWLHRSDSDGDRTDLVPATKGRPHDVQTSPRTIEDARGAHLAEELEDVGGRQPQVPGGSDGLLGSEDTAIGELLQELLEEAKGEGHSETSHVLRLLKE
jgi:hypothetical protein